MSMPGHPLPAPSVTVSVASHGQRNLVAALLEQLATLRDPSLARVVIVHNLPDADLPKPPNATFDLVQLHNPEPLGFSANHNRAFAHCVTPWFAILNPDLEFRFGNPFPALLEAAAADPRLGAVAPTLLQPGTLHVEPPRGMVTPIELIRRRLPGWKPPAEPAWLVGAFLFIRAKAFKALGGFDERFRLYCEDVDLGLRLRDAGWRIRRIEGARVLHQTQRRSHRNLEYTLLHVSSLLRLWMQLAIRPRSRPGRR
jgi:N-acetylglucosaminyl-diphospho-decaprenol L-rhamnosyltransferase